MQIRIPTHGNNAKNYDSRKSDPNSPGPCVVCGTPVPPGDYYTLHVVDGGGYACTPDEDETVDPAGDLYYLPIGRGCVTKHPELRPYVRGKGGKPLRSRKAR